MSTTNQSPEASDDERQTTLEKDPPQTLLPPEEGEAQPLVARPAGSKLTSEQVVETYGITDAEYSVLLRTVCKDAPREMAAFFMLACKKRNLDPFSKQVYFWPDKTISDGPLKGKPEPDCNWNIVTSIGGLRAIASRSPYFRGRSKFRTEFARNEDGSVKLFEKTDSQWQHIAGKRIPTDCTVSVYRAIPQAPSDASLYMEFESHIRFDEYVKRRGGKIYGNWEMQPEHQFEKCAEADAYRAAFPEECGGIYIEEEMRDNRVVYQEPANDPVQFDDEIKDLAKQAGWSDLWLVKQFDNLKDRSRLLDELNKAIKGLQRSSRTAVRTAPKIEPEPVNEPTTTKEGEPVETFDDAAPSDAPGSITPKTRNQFFGALADRGIKGTDRTARHDFAEKHGVNVDTFKKLSERDALHLLDVLTVVISDGGERAPRVMKRNCTACGRKQGQAHKAKCPLDETDKES